jgi:hypothetical protein
LRWPFRSTSAEAGKQPAEVPGQEGDASWKFEAGSRIAPERSVLKRLGGGTRYEVCLVWDERLAELLSRMLAKDPSERSTAAEVAETLEPLVPARQTPGRTRRRAR